MIKQDCIDRILAKESLLIDVIQDSTTMKRSGANLKGCCPIHDESTPSFVYSPTKGIYKCFGCGAAGFNASQFLMEMGKTFPESMEILSARTGIALEYENGNREEYQKEYAQKSKRKASGAEMMDSSYSILKAQSKVLESYEGKDWSAEDVEKWGIVVVDGGNPLSHSDLDKDGLIDIGMIPSDKNKKDKNKKYDTFLKHIMYPIYDRLGKTIISYTARSIGWKKGDKWGKWRNGAETILYNKSEVLYGFHLACLPPKDAKGNVIKDDKGRPMKSPVAEAGYCYLVEGAPNVIALHRIGIKNVVATCGTSLTVIQAKLLATVTDKVCVIPDHDAAGYKSVYTTTEQLLKAQVQAQVLLYPDDIQRGKDIYDFVTEQDMDGDDMRSHYDMYVRDALMYCTSDNYNKKTSTQHDADRIMKVAVRYLSHIKADSIRELYTKDISKGLGLTVGTFRDALNELKSKDKDSELTAIQSEDKMRYGIWNKGNCMMNRNDVQVANFDIENPYLIRSADAAYRVINIKNYAGERYVMQLPQKTVTNHNDFKTMVEGFGHFMFRGNAEDYACVRDKVYSLSDNAQLTEILGYHATTGCYVYSNGVVYPDGEFHAVNEYGVVAYDDYRFFMPTYSIIKRDQERSMRTDKYELAFSYPDAGSIPSGCPSDFSGFGKEFASLWGDRGIVPLCFMIATAYRDIVAARFSGAFPICHLFGKTNSGKSHMANTLASIFRKHVPPTDCNTSTNASFYRLLMLSYNTIGVYEELSSGVEELRKDFLKQSWDGNARSIADKDSSHKITQQEIRQSCMTLGQTFPSNDPAFINRLLTESFEEVEISKDIEDRSQALLDWSDAGYLIPIVSELHGMRGDFEENYNREVDRAKSVLKMKLSEVKVNPRIINNYAQMLGTYFAISLLVEVPYDHKRVLDVMVDRIEKQVAYTIGADELTHWWDDVAHLIAKNIISESYHSVEPTTEIKLDNGQVYTCSPKKVLYINLSYAYQEYKANNNDAETKSTIKSYLTQSPAYIGVVKAKKCDGKVRRCHVFDTTKLPGQELRYTGSNSELNDVVESGDGVPF